MGRPKRVVLLVGENPMNLSARKMMFQVHLFKVLVAETPNDAILFLTFNPVDVAVVETGSSLEDTDALVKSMKQVKSDVPVILTSCVVRSGQIAHNADAFLGVGCCSPIELYERVRIMAQRKRGPKGKVAHG